MIGNIKSKEIAEKQLKNNGFVKTQFTSDNGTIESPMYWIKNTDVDQVFSVAQIFLYDDLSCSLFISHISDF